MKTYLKVLHILSWIPLIAIKLALVLLGLIMVPICLATTGGDFTGIFWLWGNDKSKGVPDWWLNNASNKWWTRYWPRFWWYAVRNPVNNLRYVFEDTNAGYIVTNWQVYSDEDDRDPMEAQGLVDAKQQMAYRWVYAGPFAGYRRVWINEQPSGGEPGKYSEIWFGWKLSSDVPGLGFTTQVRLKRDIGT